MVKHPAFNRVTESSSLSAPTIFKSFADLAEWPKAGDCKPPFREFESHSRLQFMMRSSSVGRALA